VPHLEVWRAVRTELTAVVDECCALTGRTAEPPLVLVACSGGADSLSRAAALAHEAGRAGAAAGGIVVDHGLQDGSAGRARTVGAALTELGLTPVETVHVQVLRGSAGPEGSARQARYAALDRAAARHRAAAVLLGHTLDDQAETVLLGLARGSGARSLAGMPARSGLYRRPLLRLPRALVRAAVPAGLDPWEDPHNMDPAYARSRVRHQVLPILEKELGPGITAALARTGELLRADADVLDMMADQALRAAALPAAPEPSAAELSAGHPPPSEVAAPASSSRYDIGHLGGVPQAVRWRALREAAVVAGCAPTDLTAAHIEAIDTLIMAWRGQKGVDLPGSVRAKRHGGVLAFVPTPHPPRRG
jgi:tRNA(Ile)-lysidine synthetase-like protein